jgi:pimeloyl-ACP methyl ester carboxylesterase
MEQHIGSVQSTGWAVSVAAIGMAAAILIEPAAGAPCAPPVGTSAIEFQSGSNTLRGFIELPVGTGKHPAIMIVHGGAATNVMVDTYLDELRHAFKVAGIATLIWDKAGNGCSEGQYSSALPIQERATETLAALAMLKKREDIDSRRIGAWALSQGGWIAPMSAVRSDDIAFLIIVSGPAKDALSQGAYPAVGLLRQAGASAAEAKSAYATLRRALAVMRAGGTAEEALTVSESLQKYSILREKYQMDSAGAKQLQSFLAAPEWSLTAEEFLRQVKQPTLAIFGKRDSLVDWEESVDVYRRAFKQSGNRNLTIRIFEDADHEMLPSKASLRRNSMYVHGYVETMVAWLNARGFAGTVR